MKENISNIPKIRFPGFNDDWEQCKLGEISDIKTGPFGSTLHADDYVDDGIPIITTEHFKTGLLQQEKTGLPQVSNDDYKRLSSYTLRNGDIVFSRVGSVDINAQITPFQDGWLFSGRVLRVRPSEEYSSSYLHAVLDTEIVKNDIRSRAVGQTMPSINTEILKATELMVSTSLDEQKQIGEFLTNLDNAITLHQRKFDGIKEYKKGMLQKMFPKEGEKVPEIRFPEFTGDWEQRKLGDYLQEITYGFTNPMSDTFEGPWKITAKDIVNGNINFSFARHTSQVEYDNLTDKSKPHIGDLLLTKDGTLGRTAVVNTENICINQSVALLRCYYEKIKPEFLQVLLEAPYYQQQMLDDAGGGTINHIYITKVDKMDILVPKLAEQTQLVAFLQHLNSLITLHQRKLDQMREYKKGLLQQMFV